MRDLGEGTGTFIKVDRQFILKNGHIVSFGESHMVVGLVLEKKERTPKNEESKLTVKKDPASTLVTQLMVQFIDGPKSKETQ